MGRLKGSKNKIKQATIPQEERLKILANLVVDRLLEELKTGRLKIKTNI